MLETEHNEDRGMENIFRVHSTTDVILIIGEINTTEVPTSEYIAQLKQSLTTES